ncbi:MAG: hypothetical protein H0V09_03630 [Gemmatimonadetes bacterium]|nr:hypothetical protein [Gemmatimonadota bacterium]
MKVVPLPPSESTELPFVYDIAMGVRRGDDELKARLEETLRRRQADVSKILEEYGVPVLARRGPAGLPPAEDDDDDR